MNRLFWLLLALALGCSNPAEPQPRTVCVDYWDATTDQLVPGPCEVVP